MRKSRPFEISSTNLKQYPTNVRCFCLCNLPLGLTYRCITSPVKCGFAPPSITKRFVMVTRLHFWLLWQHLCFQLGSLNPSMNSMYLETVFRWVRCSRQGERIHHNAPTFKGVTQMVGFGLSICFLTSTSQEPNQQFCLEVPPEMIATVLYQASNQSFKRRINRQPNALYVLWAGANDYLQVSSATVPVENVTRAIALADVGQKNILVICQTGRLPATRTGVIYKPQCINTSA